MHLKNIKYFPISGVKLKRSLPIVNEVRTNRGVVHVNGHQFVYDLTSFNELVTVFSNLKLLNYAVISHKLFEKLMNYITILDFNAKHLPKFFAKILISPRYDFKAHDMFENMIRP